MDAFGRDNLSVEIQRHFLRGEERINRELIDLAAHYRLPVLATNGVQYARPRGRQVLDVFTCIREHLDAAGKLLTQNSERHLKSVPKCASFFAICRKRSTTRRAWRNGSNSRSKTSATNFPSFPVPDGHDMNSFLRTITLFGAQQRYSSISTDVKTQA